MEGKQLAKGRAGMARRVGRRFSEGQRSKGAEGWVEEWEDVSPGNIRSGIGSSSWVEKDTFTKFDVA